MFQETRFRSRADRRSVPENPLRPHHNDNIQEHDLGRANQIVLAVHRSRDLLRIGPLKQQTIVSTYTRVSLSLEAAAVGSRFGKIRASIATH